ncbi:hypothetical protein CIHG_04185 [Coccidioides immitis H538.4]|uniref:Uncharacterized protein n=1 Tax=Coccidioides immitis H538.4 TaxID=396776 RepID=A0A0J8RP85_COCIT|nr:hypothetical protein CIHG_04185 [Coccidioides immitis H538.4]
MVGPKSPQSGGDNFIQPWSAEVRNSATKQRAEVLHDSTQVQAYVSIYRAADVSRWPRRGQWFQALFAFRLEEFQLLRFRGTTKSTPQLPLYSAGLSALSTGQ